MTRMKNKPELLAPAGNMEKCKIALRYGADAVYLGGKMFGLRAFANNFSIEEIAEDYAKYNENISCSFIDKTKMLPHLEAPEKFMNVINIM